MTIFLPLLFANLILLLFKNELYTDQFFGFRDSAPDPIGGAYSAPPNPFAEISNSLFEIITEMLWEKQF